MENIEDSLLDLFKTIENSPSYLEYVKIKEQLKKDTYINSIIDKIKELEKKATYMESIKNLEYKNIDKEIKSLEDRLYNNKLYKEYIDKMDKFNKEISLSSKIINDYLEEVV